jgi:hypothetical protein
MTTDDATNGLGTWSVDAFHQAITRVHLNVGRLIAFSNTSDESVVPVLTACGALPSRWPEGAAYRLAVTLIQALLYRDTPYYRDTFETNLWGRVLYHDGWDDLRDWMEKLRIEGRLPNPPGALLPLLAVVGMSALTERLGPDRTAAFVTRLRQERDSIGLALEARGRELETESGGTVKVSDLRWPVIANYADQAAALGRYAGLKYENVALLAQADQDEAAARAAWKHVRLKWCPERRREGSDAPPAPDDPDA